MRRPEPPYKKATGIVGLVGLVLFMTRRFDFIPDWVMWVGIGLLAVFEIYLLFWAMRQGCWAYTAVNVGAILVIGISYYLLTSLTPDVSDAGSNPLLFNICLYSIIVLAAVVLLFDIVAAYFMIRRRSYPVQYARMRRLIWPVNFGLYFLIFILCLIMINS